MGGRVAYVTTTIPPRTSPQKPGVGAGTLHDTGMNVTLHNKGDAVIPANSKVVIYQHPGGVWTIDKVLT
jgi:hypothetical protein